MDVTATLRLVYIPLQVFGLLPFSLKKSNGIWVFSESKSHLIYVKVLNSAVILIQGFYMSWSVFFISKGFEFAPEISSKTVMMISSAVSYSALPLTIRIILKERKPYRYWLNRINRLFADMSEQELKKVKYQIFAYVIISLSSHLVILVSQMQMPKEIVDNVQKTIDSLPFWQVCVADLYVIVLDKHLFLLHFLAMVKLLSSYYEGILGTLKIGAVRTGSTSRLSYLRDLRSRDLELNDFVDFIQGFFMPLVSLELLWAFTTVLLHVCIAARIGLPPLFQALWSLVILLEVLTMVGVCHSAEKAAKETAHYLHRLFIGCDDLELKEEIEIFSLQVQHTKVEFHSVGSWKLDLTFVRTMIGSLTSYAVILLQFRDQTEPADVCYKTIITNCSAIPT